MVRADHTVMPLDLTYPALTQRCTTMWADVTQAVNLQNQPCISIAPLDQLARVTPMTANAGAEGAI